MAVLQRTSLYINIFAMSIQAHGWAKQYELTIRLWVGSVNEPFSGEESHQKGRIGASLCERAEKETGFLHPLVTPVYLRDL